MPDFNMNIKKLNPHAVLPVQGSAAAAGLICAPACRRP